MKTSHLSAERGENTRPLYDNTKSPVGKIPDHATVSQIAYILCSWLSGNPAATIVVSFHLKAIVDHFHCLPVNGDI